MAIDTPSTLTRKAFVDAVLTVTDDPKILQVAREQKKFAVGAYFADDKENGAVCGCVVGQFILEYAVLPDGAERDIYTDDPFDKALRRADDAIGPTISVTSKVWENYADSHGDENRGSLYHIGSAIDDAVCDAWYREHQVAYGWYGVDNRILTIVD